MSHNSTPAGRRRASITEFLLAQQSSPQPDDDAVEVIHAADLEAAGYMLGEQLGEGRFSKVHLGTHVASGAEHAVKVVDRSSLDEDDEAVEALQVEVAALTAARHENVVRLHAVVHTSEAVYLLMELLAGGELFDSIVEKGRYGEGEARGLVRQLLGAVESCHARGIVHRDLKPENMLFAGAEDAAAGPTLKLIDFGYAAMISADGGTLRGLSGTPDYVAPEVLSWYADEDGDKGEAIEYDASVDLWSVGVVLYILLCGFPPFYGDDEEGTIAAVREAEVEFADEHWGDVSKEAIALIRACLDRDPRRRPTATQALGHAWLAGGAPAAGGGGEEEEAVAEEEDEEAAEEAAAVEAAAAALSARLNVQEDDAEAEAAAEAKAAAAAMRSPLAAAPAAVVNAPPLLTDGSVVEESRALRERQWPLAVGGLRAEARTAVGGVAAADSNGSGKVGSFQLTFDGSEANFAAAPSKAALRESGARFVALPAAAFHELVALCDARRRGLLDKEASVQFAELMRRVTRQAEDGTLGRPAEM